MGLSKVEQVLKVPSPDSTLIKLVICKTFSIPSRHYLLISKSRYYNNFHANLMQLYRYIMQLIILEIHLGCAHY